MTSAYQLDSVTTGLYVNIILVDYVRTILNLQRTNSPWRLDPRLNADVYDPRKTPEGMLYTAEYLSL